MDEDAYRQTYHEVNENYCVFEKGILTSQARCSKCQKMLIAEREAANCTDIPAQQICKQYLEVMKEHARFSLKLRDTRQNLGHAKAIKVQIGSLRGLYQALHPEQPVPAPIPEIAGLIEEAVAHYGALENLPFSQIIPAINTYEGRKRRSRKK
ncbi:hypothetical protein [Thiolapillus sp.]|uniref:hypothetical protein n=2 Tax=Thiolapillus sp. TaxID=2017437 RepID=UPI0025D52B5F|nr:hypothetical protein [Thiolapillus sp.]